MSKGGRPLKFKTVEDLLMAINDWLDECEHDKQPLTITGLAIALDTSRETLLDYEGREEYSDAIKRAKLMCQHYAEQYLFTGKNVTGAIFNLKNNYGWADKTETDITTKGEAINAPVDPEVAKRFADFVKRETADGGSD